MDNHLEIIKRAYDKGIVEGRKGNGIHWSEDLPEYIANDPEWPAYQKLLEASVPTSGRAEVKDYLSPEKGMNFVDLGCCLNLRSRGYAKWPSTYHGVDISPETIKLLHEFVERYNFSVGALYCGGIHETPFEDNYFDIGTCIGVLEYFERDYIEKALIEAHRIIKPNGKFIIGEIPNITSTFCRLYMMIEEYLERPVNFNMSLQEFEDMLKKYFTIENAEIVDGAMYGMYFLKCKK